MKNNPFVSIIVPIYKIPEEFLKKCIDSIINQDFNNIEIILIDDESPDNCGKICDEYAELDKRIVVIHQKNQGVSIARNSGIDRAKGDWISFVDADDWIEPNYISKFYNMSLKSSGDILMCDCYVNYTSKQVKNKFFNKSIIEAQDENKDRFLLQYLCNKIHGDDLANTDIGSPWAKVYRRNFLINNNLRFDKKLIRMQDNVFNLYAFEKANSLYYEEDYLYHYRKSEFSGFSRFNPNIITYYELVFNELESFIDNYKKSKVFNIAKKIKVVKSIYVYCKMFYFHKDNTMKIKDINNNLKILLNKEPYKSAISDIEFKYLSLIEKAFTICIKYKMVNLLRILIFIKNFAFKITGRGTS
jgi:glycosyltransferase involved in cell wall biosynthesis